MTQEENKKKFQITDRRFWVQDDSKIDKTQISGPQYPSVVEELKARTELAEQKLKEKLQEIDKENNAFRRRLSKEMDKRLQREKINKMDENLWEYVGYCAHFSHCQAFLALFSTPVRNESGLVSTKPYNIG